MNPQNVVGDANTSKGVANIHIDWQDNFTTGAGATLADFEIHCYFLVNQ